MATARDTELWMSVFGAEAETWGWSEIEFLEGDWDVPGVARVRFFDPDYDDDPDGDDTEYPSKDLRMADIWLALNRTIELGLRDACTGAPIHETCEWDACTADTLLQVAVLGKIVFA